MDSADVVDLDFALIHQNISIKTSAFWKDSNRENLPQLSSLSTRFVNFKKWWVDSSDYPFPLPSSKNEDFLFILNGY